MVASISSEIKLKPAFKAHKNRSPGPPARHYLKLNRLNTFQPSSVLSPHPQYLESTVSSDGNITFAVLSTQSQPPPCFNFLDLLCNVTCHLWFPQNLLGRTGVSSAHKVAELERLYSCKSCAYSSDWAER